jgi:hypothetical protein
LFIILKYKLNQSQNEQKSLVLGCRLCFLAMTPNVLGLAEGGGLEAQMLNFALMPNRITNVQFSTLAPLLASLHVTYKKAVRAI